jgi:hypothetical protein
MTQRLAEFRTTWLTGGIHLLILVIAFQFESISAWPFALAAMAAVSFFAWMANYRRYRQIHDLPTSKVASAAQGYVELFGRSQQIPDTPLVSPFTGLPCCWYRYCVEHKTNENRWEHEDSGESSAHFVLKDDTGECVISPEGAEVLYAKKGRTVKADRRYTEWLLLPHGVLYAIGEFSTHSGVDLDLDRNRDISGLLAEWKKDAPALLQRFDENSDGVVDLREWEKARLEAQRQVEKRNAELRASPGVNLLRKPRDGRVFILAAELPTKIGRRFASWAWVHLALFFGAGSASYLMFTHVKT